MENNNEIRINIRGKIGERNVNQLKLHEAAVATYLYDKYVKEMSLSKVKESRLKTKENRLEIVIYYACYVCHYLYIVKCMVGHQCYVLPPNVCKNLTKI